MPKIGDIVAGKYEVERVIGEGGMGAVFAAMHKLTGRRVALKWMLPELARDADAVQRFMREAQAAGRINHPNVVDVYDVGQHDDSFFLVMEFLQGEPLTAALDRRDLSIGEVIDLLLPAMRGVAAAHRGGVVHRDLKPDNVFLARSADGKRTVKILDYGLAKFLSPGDDPVKGVALTMTGMMMGTPLYMPPEQASGKKVDVRVDVYAAGCVLFEMWSGQPPYLGETHGEILRGHMLSPVPKLGELRSDAIVTPALQALFDKAMAKQPEQRFADAEQMLAALEALPKPVLRARGQISDFRPSAVTDVLPRHPVKDRTLWLASLAAAVVVVGALLFLWLR